MEKIEIFVEVLFSEVQRKKRGIISDGYYVNAYCKLYAIMNSLVFGNSLFWSHDTNIDFHLFPPWANPSCHSHPHPKSSFIYFKSSFIYLAALSYAFKVESTQRCMSSQGREALLTVKVLCLRT